MRLTVQTNPVSAYCDACGVIGFTRLLDPHIPFGAIKIVSGKGDLVMEAVSQAARLAPDNHTLLVPGVPEDYTMGKDITPRIAAFRERVLRIMQRMIMAPLHS
ncbi:MAG: hypothetical protein DVB22_002570 [Verrucomicrobia bacterium]|nr:MAG: hypothetical protein DVB22_002570 [Verrucomicrobiota bacterium]